MHRVVVAGCPGAGKTTFSRKLAAKTGLPLIHLDYYHHLTEFDYPHHLDDWVACVTELTKQDSWIMDGNYNSSIEVRFARADTIIFFDFSRLASLYGVVKRRLQYARKKREEMPEDWKEVLTLGFLFYVWQFKDNNRKATMEALERAKEKEVHIFKNHRQAAAYLASLKAPN